ncbi:hypothetical protein M758_5G195600 [Ceratodon purpureus]|nr:hypothetical protein M758_5G195600 [Ceratodon purpureus]
MDMGRGFIFLSTPSIVITRRVLALTPHHTPWGQCIYQEWEPNFNPDYPSGLKLPTWISLTKLPHEFKPVEGLIAGSLGPVYQADLQNRMLRDPRFCVGLDLTKGWPSALELVGIGNHLNTIVIGYDHAPIRCRFCQNLNHRVVDCSELKLNGMSSATDPHRNDVQRALTVPPTEAMAVDAPGQLTNGTHPSPSQDSQLGEDAGFTIVKSRKSKHPPKPPARAQPCEAPTVPRKNPEPVQPILTSEQVLECLGSPKGDEVGLSMSWSPGRYGRNPGYKRGAGNSSLPHSPVRSNANSKRLVLSPPDPPPTNPLQAVEQLGELCIIRDEPPASAFKKIEAIQQRGANALIGSEASSSLHLADFPTQHLTSSPTCIPGVCAQQSPCSSSSAPIPSPYAGSLPISEATSKAGQPSLSHLSDSSSESGARASSVRLAATYKAKWSAMTRRLEEAAPNPSQSVPTSTPPIHAQ